MDGRYITEARTAAVSAVSARFLGRADAATLAIIGSGVQARSHLEAYQRRAPAERSAHLVAASSGAASSSSTT